MKFTFGVEKLGHLCLRAPRIAIVVLMAIAVAAAFGAVRMNVDDSLTELFRADTPEFNQYERLTNQFPSSEYDVLVVVQGKTLLTPAGLDAMRNAVLELQFVEGLRGIVSIFSAREPPSGTEIPPPLFPAELPTGEAFDQLVAKIRKNEIIQGKLMSEDGELTLIVIALDRAMMAGDKLPKVVGEIERIMRENLEGTGLSARLSGAPVMQLEIRNAVRNDRIRYNGIGLGMGALICLIFFRRLSLTLIAIAGPAMAILWVLGLLGAFDVRLNLFLNVLTPLIIVFSFSDSMHMVFMVRRRMMSGDSAIEAARHIVAVVTPACFLTAVTTAIAFFSFLIAPSALITTFGIAGILATVLTFVAVNTLVPTLAALLMRPGDISGESFRTHDLAMNQLNRLMAWIGRNLRRFAFPIAVLGVALTLASGWAHFQLEPRYRLADQVPDREQALAAVADIEKKLTGANPIHVLIEWKDGRSLYSPEILEAVRRIHRIIGAHPKVGNVWSLETLREWLERAGEPGVEPLKRYVELLPEHLVRRFIAPEGNALVITGRLPDIDASALLPVVGELNERLADIRRDYPNLEISITGLPVIAALNSGSMIRELNAGLFGEIFTVTIILGLAFRSLWKGFYSIVPNLFPILATGAVLYLLGDGLHFASVIALTVAFGLSTDNIIHFLYRLHLEDQQEPGGAAAVERAVQIVGPALTLTTIVLIVGLAVPVLSDLPSLRIFGMLSAITLGFALVGVLLLLPALVFMMRKLLDQSKGIRTPGAETPAFSPEPPAHRGVDERR